MTDDRGNLGAIFAAHAGSGRPAIIDLSDQAAPREISYAALDAACNAVARALTAHGLGPGDRIGILGLNRHEYIAVMFGAMRAGIVPVPINIKLPARGVAEIAGDAGAKLIFSDAGARALCPPELPVVEFDGDYPSFGDPGPFEPVAPGDDGVAFQPYTSGSTGRPKGVLLSHKAHLWVARTLAENRRILPGDALLVAAPLYHKNAMNIVKSGLAAGGAIVLLPRFDACAYIRAAGRYRVKALSGVPTMYALMLQQSELLAATDLSAVRLLTLGSAPTSTALFDTLSAAFPEAEVRLSFGITESSPVMFGPHPDGLTAPRNSIGWPLPDTEIRLESRGTGPLPHPATLRDHPMGGRVGERAGAARSENALEGGDGPDQGVLVVRTPGMMLGYHNMEEETARRLKDGWFDTGDILRRDTDGWYYFVGRIDDMFSSGGNNIYPGEVESVLERHPDIYQAVVVAAPHALKDKVPYAYVVPRPDAALTEDAVKQYVLENLAPSHHPRRVFFLDALPLAGTNKIDRKALQARAEEDAI